VLIVHPGTLGDVLLAVEAIRAIRSAFPSHQVVWVGQSEVGKLLLACEEVNEIIGIEGPFLSKLLAHPKHLDDQLKGTLERCTHCVGWMTDHDEIFSNILQFFGIRCIFQSPQSSEFADFHQEERFVKTLQPWGITAHSQKKRLPLLSNVRHPFQSDYLASKFLTGCLTSLLTISPNNEAFTHL